MENPASFVPLHPLKPADEAELTKLIDSLGNLSNFNIDAISKMRDLFFQLPQADFHGLVLNYSNRFLTILFGLFRICKQTDDQTMRKLLILKTNFLSFLSYINFTIFTPRASKESIELISKQISECSISDLSYILRIIRASFESWDPEIEAIRQRILSDIILSIRNRLVTILRNIDSINMRILMSVLTLLQMLSTSNRFIVPIIPIFEQILRYEIPNNLPLPNLLCLFVLQSKVATILMPVTNTDGIIPAIIRMLLKTPIKTIIENSTAILRNYFKKDAEQRIVPLLPHVPNLLDFRLLTSENFNAYLQLIKYIFDELARLKKIDDSNENDDSLFLRYCKYTASILHFRKAPFGQCSSQFHIIFSSMNIPTNSSLFRKSLISLFIFSFSVATMEIEQQNAKVMDMMNNKKDPLITFYQLLCVSDSYFRLIGFLKRILEITGQCDMFNNRPFLSQVAFSFNRIEFKQLVDLLVRSLLLMMRYREALQRSIEMVRYIEPAHNTHDHYRLCMQYLKAVRTYEKARTFHLLSAKEMITECISKLPSYFAIMVWDNFFEQFFQIPDLINLDSCTFRVVISDHHSFPCFYSSITDYICKRLKNGYNLANFLKSLQFLFEKLSMKPSAPPNILENPEKVFAEANKVIDACREKLSDPLYCGDILLFIRYFALFMDFITISAKFSTQMVNDGFVSMIIRNASHIPFTQKALCNFIAFSASKRQDILKNSYVIEFLINCLPIDFSQSLKLLQASKKLDKKKFFQHHLMPLFYNILIRHLDDSSSEIKQLIMKFLRKIPTKHIKNIDFVSSDILFNRCILFEKGDHELSIEISPLIKSIRMALTQNINVDFLWDLLNKIMLTFTIIQNWTSNQHTIFYHFLITILHYNPKNDDILLKYYSKMSETDNLVIKSHLLLAISSKYQTIPLNVLNSIFQNIQSKQTFSVLINNIIAIIDILNYSTRTFLPSICKSIIHNVDTCYIDEISFAILVHRAVIDSYSIDWVEEQHSDMYTNFPELNYLSEDSIHMIQFCRERLSNKSISVLPILNQIKLSTSLLPILVAVEMISKNENFDEVYQFIDVFLSNQVACYEYGDCRILGPLARAFPSILHKYSDIISSIIKDATDKISRLNNRKYQGLFLVILLPVLNSNKFSSIIDYNLIYNMCNQILNLKSSPLLKSQAQQVYHALYRYGPKEIQQNICQHFETIAKSGQGGYLKWTPFIDVAFTYFVIFPKELFEIAKQDLDLIKRGITQQAVQLTNVNDFFKTVISNFSFLSSGKVIRYIITTNQFDEVAQQLITVYNRLTYIRKSFSNKYAMKFFRQCGDLFPVFFNNNVNDTNVACFFANLISEPKMQELFNKYEYALKFNAEIIRSLPILIIIVLNTNLKETHMDSIMGIAHQMIDAFDEHYTKFNPYILKEIVSYFAQNNINNFLQLSFQVFKKNSLLLTSLFAQSTKSDISLELFMSLKYSDDDDVNFAFLEAFLLPVLQKRPEWLKQMVPFIHDTLTVPVFLQFANSLYKARILTEKLEYDAYDIYQQCKTDEMHLQALLYWSYSGTSHFVEMFLIFANFFNVHLPMEIRTAADTLKIPENCYNNPEICAAFIELLNMFSRNPMNLNTVLTIYINNVNAFKLIDSKIWEFIQEQTIQFANPRLQFIQYKVPFICLSKLIPTKGPLTDNENALAVHLINFANLLLEYTKKEKNKYEALFSVRGGFLKCIINLCKTFGTRVQFTSEIFEIIIEVYKSNVQAGPQVSAFNGSLFEMLMIAMPELVEVLSQHSQFPHIDEYLDFLLDYAKHTQPLWPLAFSCLSDLAKSSFYKEMVAEKIIKVYHDNEEFMIYAFPILWKNPPTEGYRMSSLIPALLKFCTAYNPEKPVDMLLSDSILSLLFEDPKESALFSLLKHCEDCIERNNVNENCIFFSRVILRGLLSKKKDLIVQKQLLRFLENPKAQYFFTIQPYPITKEIFDLLTVKIKISSAAFLYREFKDEMSDLLDKTDYKRILCMSKTSEVAASICFSSFFDDVKPIDLLNVLVNMPNSVNVNIVNQVSTPFSSNDSLNFKLIIGNESILLRKRTKSLHNLSKWSMPNLYSESSVSNYLTLGLPEFARKNIPNSINEITFSEINELLRNNPNSHLSDPHLEELYNSLCDDDHTVKYYSEKLNQILSQSTYFATASSFPSLMIIRQSKHFLTSLNSNSHNKNSGVKLFNYVLSPIFDPKIHQAYQECRSLMLAILKKNGSLSSNLSHQCQERELIHIRNLMKSKEYHFVEHLKDNLKFVVQFLSSQQSFDSAAQSETLINLLLEGLKINKKNDIFLTAALAVFDHIQPKLLKLFGGDCKIPFKWSQLFAEKGTLEFVSILHPAFLCAYLNRDDYPVSDVTIRNVCSFLQIMKTVCKTRPMQRILELFKFETKLADQIRTEICGLNQKRLNIDSSDALINNENASLLVKTFTINQIPAPLYQIENSQIISCSFYLQSTESLHCKMTALLASGITIAYLIMPCNPMETRLGTFFDVISSSLLVRSPSNLSRAQKLISVPSLPIIDDFYLCQTTSSPFVANSHLKKLIDTYSDMHTNPSNLSIKDDTISSEQGSRDVQRYLNYSTKKEFCNWFWHFSTRFAATSFLQIINDYAVFNPYQLMCDYKKATIVYINQNLISDIPDLSLFRFCGEIKQNLDTTMIDGPFSLGLMSAANSLSFNIEKFKFFSKIILNKELSRIEHEVSKIRQFSSLDRNIDDVQHDLKLLIQKSYGASDTLFSLPWI